MRILHTSDWHIGRTFHGNPTLPHLRLVLAALAEQVRRRGVDVVVIAGDVFDASQPSAAALEVLGEAVRAIRAAGARIVMTSGNHDSVTRLGIHAEWIDAAGIHVRTRHEVLDVPVSIDDEHGPVHFYGIPYLAPTMLRGAYPGVPMEHDEHAIAFAMERVRHDLAVRGGRSVVLAHCFAADVPESGEERGGLDLVPVRHFAGVDYVALGHIHGRNRIAPGVRYSGAPLHYSFAEGGKPRGAWVVDLDAAGLAGEPEWLELPVPRRLTTLTGTLETLLADPAHDVHEGDWVRVQVTDRVRPIDGMRAVQRRFPHCAEFEWRPAVVSPSLAASYSARVSGRGDDEVIAGFLEHVRGGVGPSDFERRLVAEVLAARSEAERSA